MRKKYRDVYLRTRFVITDIEMIFCRLFTKTLVGAESVERVDPHTLRVRVSSDEVEAKLLRQLVDESAYEVCDSPL